MHIVYFQWLVPRCLRLSIPTFRLTSCESSYEVLLKTHPQYTSADYFLHSFIMAVFPLCIHKTFPSMCHNLDSIFFPTAAHFHIHSFSNSSYNGKGIHNKAKGFILSSRFSTAQKTSSPKDLTYSISFFFSVWTSMSFFLADANNLESGGFAFSFNSVFKDLFIIFILCAWGFFLLLYIYVHHMLTEFVEARRRH